MIYPRIFETVIGLTQVACQRVKIIKKSNVFKWLDHGGFLKALKFSR